jgi:hypothetical protein
MFAMFRFSDKSTCGASRRNSMVSGKAGGLIDKIVGQPIGTEFDYEKLLPLVEAIAATGAPINKPASHTG